MNSAPPVTPLSHPAQSDAAPTSGPEIRHGTTVSIAAVSGADPLVARYLAHHRTVCAHHTLSWAWLGIGATAAVGTAFLAQALWGTVQALPPDRGGLAVWFNRYVGDPATVLPGLLAGGVIASLIGGLTTRRTPTGQEPLLAALALAALWLPLYDPLLGVGIVAGALTLVYLAVIAFRLLAVLVGRDTTTPPPAVADTELPIYTVLVPLYREKAVATSILRALARLDYPRDKLDVKFLLEADDPETLPALQAAGLPTWAEIIVVPPAQPKTKPRACNHGLMRARGEFTVIYDAEDRPEPDQLRLAVAAFRASDARTACLQAHLAYHNHAQNLLTRFFALEYNVWFRRYLPGLVRLGVPIPLGGTSNHFRTEALHRLGGWDPFNVTEDCDLGVRLHLAGLRTRILPSTTWEEANSRVGNWLRQRSRWIKGYFITHLVWCRRPWWLLATLGPWGALGFLCCVGGFAALAVLNLLLWCASAVQATCLAIDLVHGHHLWNLLTTRDLEHTRWSWPIWFAGPLEDPLAATLSQLACAAAVVMLAGNLLFILVTLVYGRRPGQRGLVTAAFCSPLYWLLISLAAVKGVVQLLTRPHYWEKTVHGLDHETTTQNVGG